MAADHERHPSRLIVVMGVAGCGKSSVGIALARRLGQPFIDADEFHPPANVAKMSRGVPLTDADRWPWLDNLGAAMQAHADRTGGVVTACSALRRSYRERLIMAAGESILFIFLDGTQALIAERMAARTGHFMPTGLLDSQFATLEPPGPDENHLKIDIGPGVPTLVESIHNQLNDRTETEK
ncbi:MAG: gluconokinase [Gammaproteobacteria bacterium]|nr:gluconokinase [Gammaproteobacteria bacterium]